MLNTGIFPEKFKIAKIIHIHKKGDHTLFTNYRPISLLPAISKIFEKVIFKQLFKFFQEFYFFIMHGMDSGLNIPLNLQP